MAKLTAPEVENGMEFKLVSAYTGDLHFCWPKGSENWFDELMDPPLGVGIIVTRKPYKKEGVQMVDFVMDGIDGEFSTNWLTFKKNTVLKTK
jgi:hypothetical protein